MVVMAIVLMVLVVGLCIFAPTEYSKFITRAALGVIIGLTIVSNMTRVNSSEAPLEVINAQPLRAIASNGHFAIGLSADTRSIQCDELNALVSDLFVLYVKTLNYHWNVTGPMFNDLHQFFGQMYEEQLELIDRVAERVRALGGMAAGAMGDFVQSSDLREETREKVDDQEMLITLLSDMQSIIREVRMVIPKTHTYHDAGTAHLLGALLETLEKRAWMLRSLIG